MKVVYSPQVQSILREQRKRQLAGLAMEMAKVVGIVVFVIGWLSLG
jgi:hypothetical protein